MWRMEGNLFLDKMYGSEISFLNKKDYSNVDELMTEERAKLVKKARSKVWIIKDKYKADASRIIDILSLAAIKDSELTLLIDDPSDIEILNDLAKLIENGFGE